MTNRRRQGDDQSDLVRVGEFVRAMDAIKDQLTEGFDRLTRRQDTANGRTTANEARILTNELAIKALQTPSMQATVTPTDGQSATMTVRLSPKMWTLLLSLGFLLQFLAAIVAAKLGVLDAVSRTVVKP